MSGRPQTDLPGTPSSRAHAAQSLDVTDVRFPDVGERERQIGPDERQWRRRLLGEQVTIKATAAKRRARRVTAEKGRP